MADDDAYGFEEPEDGFDDTPPGGAPGEGRIQVFDPMDPVFSSSELARHLERPLKYTSTMEGFALLFGNASLGSGDIAATTRNRSVRRMLEVFPPDEVLEYLPPHRRWLHSRVRQVGPVTPVEEGQEPPKQENLHGNLRRGEMIVRKPQRWFVFSTTHEEDYQRSRKTGIFRIPRKPLQRKWQKKLAGLREAGRFESGVDLMPEEELSLCVTLSETRRELSEVYSLHRRAFFLHVSGRDSVQFDSQDNWDFWERVLKTAGRIPGVDKAPGEREDPLPVDKEIRRYPSDKPFTSQTVEESIAAAQALFDYFSTVLQGPLIETYSEAEAKEYRVRCGVLRGDIEQAIFCSANEENDARKIIEQRKVRLGWQRKLALGYVDKGDPGKIGDDWPFGPMRDVFVGDLVFASTNPADPDFVPPKYYLGPLAERLPANFRPGDSRPTFNLGDGNRLMAHHVNLAEMVSRAINSIRDLLRKIESDEPVTYDDVRKLDLINWKPEDIYFTYWETDGRGNTTIPHTPAEWVEAGRPDDWVPHGVPRFDWALWANWRYVMEYLHFIAVQAVEAIEEQGERLGLNNAIDGVKFKIPTRYDGSPESNFFNLERIGWLAWQLQPVGAIRRYIEFHLGEAKENRETDVLSIYLKLIALLPSGAQGRQDIEEMIWEQRWDMFEYMEDRMAEQYNFVLLRQFKDFSSWLAHGMWTRIGDTPEARMKGILSLRKLAFWSYMAAKGGDTLQGLGESHDYLQMRVEQPADLAGLIRSRSLLRFLATDQKLDKTKYTDMYLRHEIALRLAGLGFPEANWVDTEEKRGATAKVAEKIRATTPAESEMLNLKAWEPKWLEVREFILGNLPDGSTEDDIDFKSIRSWYYTYHSLLVYEPHEVTGQAA